MIGCRDGEQYSHQFDLFIACQPRAFTEADYRNLLKTYLAKVDRKAAQSRMNLVEGSRRHFEDQRKYRTPFRRELERDEAAVSAKLQAGRKSLYAGQLDTEGWGEPGSIYPYVIADCPASARLVKKFHDEGAFRDVGVVLSALRSDSAICGEYQAFIEELLRSESLPAARQAMLKIMLFSSGANADHYADEVREWAIKGDELAAERILFEMDLRTGKRDRPRPSPETRELFGILAAPSSAPSMRYLCARYAEATGDRAKLEEICGGLLAEKYRGGESDEDKLADYGLCQYRQFAMSLLFYGARTESAFRLLFRRATATDPAMQAFPLDRRQEEIAAAGHLLDQVQEW